MRKLLTLMMAFAVLLALAVAASAHDRHGRERDWRQSRRARVISTRRYVRPVRVVTVRRPAGVLGARYYHLRNDNYGRRRSAYVHYRNAQRRALRRHIRAEHRRTRW